VNVVAVWRLENEVFMSTISFMRRKYRFLFLNDKEFDKIIKEMHGIAPLLVELVGKSKKVCQV